jgi:hypothetical protein
MTTIYTYQNVKLSLEAWHLVEEAMNVEGKNFSDAIELLIRHGAIHLASVQKEWPRQ